jgi:aryl-alcohol dehydrogenase-like predicted oxidoreductase
VAGRRAIWQGGDVIDQATRYARHRTEPRPTKELRPTTNGRGVQRAARPTFYSDGAAEEILGKAIRGRRDQVILSTKSTFRSGPGHNDVGSSRHHLIKACEASLRRLGIDYIDLYQMHGFDALSPVEETLSALDDLVHSAKVGYVGCSNFSGWHLKKSLAVSEKYGR